MDEIARLEGHSKVTVHHKLHRALDRLERVREGGEHRLGAWGPHEHTAFSDEERVVEELAEAVHAATLAQQGRGSEEEVDAELVQLAAVVTAWIEARGRRARAEVRS